MGLFIWTLSYFLESSTSTLASQKILTDISSIGVVVVSSSWLIFTVNYTSGDELITGWKFIPFIGFPAIMAFIMWHPDLRQYFWQSETLIYFDQHYHVEMTFGPFFWVFISYSYGLILAGIIMLLWKLQKTKIYMRQVALVIFAVSIPLFGGLIYFFDVFPVHRDMTPVFFTASVIIFSFALFRYNLFKVIPFANSHLIQQMQDSVLVFDRENNLIEANQKARAFLGIHSGDIGKQIESIAAFAGPLNDALFSSLDKQEITVTLSGKESILEITSLHLKNTKDQYQGKIILLSDITESRRAETALSESEERFQNMVNSMNDTVFTLDRHMRYSGLYGSQVSNLIMDPESIIGKTTWEIFGEEIREVNETNIRRALEGESVVFDWDIDYYSSHCYYQTMLYPMKDRNGEVQGVFGIGRDITEKTKAEEVLHTSNAALKSMHDAVIICDNDWIVKQWNDVSANLFCVPEEEAIGQSISNLVEMKEEYLGQNRKNIDMLIQNKQYRSTQQFRTQKGDIWTDVHSQAIEANGKQIGWIIMLEDITQQKKIEEQMLAQDRLASIGKLTAGIAHEINNPLSIIKGIIELTMDSEVSDQTKSDMMIANEEIDRASSIIKNLLTFARRESSGKSHFDMNALIMKTVEMRRYQQKQHNIRTMTDLCPDLPKVYGSELQLQQVLINIIINAEYFLSKGNGEDWIRITTNRDEEFIRIHIADNGPGISSDTQKHIFDPFFTSKTVGEGTGLGLSICYGIVQDHKGTITVESSPGEGSTFTISLPINSPEVTAEDSPDQV